MPSAFQKGKAVAFVDLDSWDDPNSLQYIVKNAPLYLILISFQLSASSLSRVNCYYDEKLILKELSCSSISQG